MGYQNNPLESEPRPVAPSHLAAFVEALVAEFGNKTSSNRNAPVSGSSSQGQQNVNKSSGSKNSGTSTKKVPK